MVPSYDDWVEDIFLKYIYIMCILAEVYLGYRFEGTVVVMLSQIKNFTAN